MTNRDNERKYDDYCIYIKSGKRWEHVSKEFYEQYTRMNDAFRHRQQAHHACVCPRNKWWLCDSDCANCEFHRGGDTLSLDQPMNDASSDGKEVTLGDTIDSGELPLDEIAEKNIRHRQLMDALPQLDDMSRKIIELILKDERERAIMDILGLPYQSSVNMRKKKAIDALRKLMSSGK